ncbi:MAG: BlaI/MecI/CopY family transcriptional regulator [Isosphaeraceae bacterium]
MARGRSETLTAREAQIMDVIWRLGQATAEQVREALDDQAHDSTIRTLLRVLESKGYVTHEAAGKAFLYQAAIARQKAQRHALRSMLTQFFGGSAETLVLRLIEDERLTAEQLDDLRQHAPEAKPQNPKPRRIKGKGTNMGE